MKPHYILLGLYALTIINILSFSLMGEYIAQQLAILNFVAILHAYNYIKEKKKDA